MSKSATDLLQESIFSALIDALAALKVGATPNTIIRDINAIHPNTDFGSLPEPVQRAIGNSVQDTLKRLQKAGYTVAAKNPPSFSPTRRK